ncbi:hypothetical protein LTR86_004855 [Recurvomyces mirabilis]|nr:hypothetical protein LTR86_004855 [Recurvomyces mirabilis]
MLDFIDPTLLSSIDLAPFLLDDSWVADVGYDLAATPSFQPYRTGLAGRLEILNTDLEAFAHSKPLFRDSFDPIAFRCLFCVANVHELAARFCHKRQYRYPIIHWPTFVLEEASLPLLMVITLTGASYSYQPKSNNKLFDTARDFYSLADSYVSDGLTACFDHVAPSNDLTERIQRCQAALLMYGLITLKVSDPELQHAALTKRLPALVSALRYSRFTSCKHAERENWQLFLQRENMIRLVAWTFCVDCLATLSYNQPPLFCVLELTGDLPCVPEVWEMDSTLDSDLWAATRSPSLNCLRDLMARFLDTTGFHQVIYNLHVAMALSTQSGKLLQTLDMWAHLWTKAVAGVPSGSNSRIGVAKYVLGMEHVTRRIVEVAASEEASLSAYLQRVPSYSTQGIHEFIRVFVARA